MPDKLDINIPEVKVPEAKMPDVNLDAFANLSPEEKQ
jgi:hypothetical protein